MTVKELVEKLYSVDPDAIVTTYDGEYNDYNIVTEIEDLQNTNYNDVRGMTVHGDHKIIVIR